MNKQSKVLWVTPAVHKKIAVIKSRKQLKTVSEVIEYLIKNNK